MPSIAIAGLGANDPVPGVYCQIDFAAGPVAGGNTSYPMLLIGNKLATGSATVDTAIYGPDTATPLLSLTDAGNLFGIGSELYRMFKRAVAINSVTPIYAIAVAESGGAAATGTITFVTPAAANGFVRVFVCDELVDVTITNGDSITTIAAAVRDAINAKIDWPVTATASLGVVTLTSRQKGLRGNWLRYGASVFGTGVATTVTPAPMSFMASGATADSYTNVLSTILPKRFYYIVSADDGGQSSGNLSALATQVTSQALPTTGIRQKVIAGAVDGTVANVTAIAVAQNSARAKVYYQYLGDVPPCELAASIAAGEAAFEAAFSSGTLNFDNFGQTNPTQAYWRIPTPRVPSAALTRAQLVTCLNNGVSPIGVSVSGKTYLVSRITTKSQTSSQADYRIRDDHKVSIMDRYGDDIQNKVALQFSGKVVQSDPLPGQRVPGPNVAYPKLLTAAVNKQSREYAESDLLQNIDQIVAGTYSNREAAPTTRLTSAVPLQPVDALHSVGLLLEQVA